jgi:hypothetical protein
MVPGIGGNAHAAQFALLIAPYVGRGTVVWTGSRSGALAAMRAGRSGNQDMSFGNL